MRNNLENPWHEIWNTHNILTTRWLFCSSRFANNEAIKIMLGDLHKHTCSRDGSLYQICWNIYNCNKSAQTYQSWKISCHWIRMFFARPAMSTELRLHMDKHKHKTLKKVIERCHTNTYIIGQACTNKISTNIQS